MTEQAWRDRRQVQAEAQAGFRAAFGWRHKLAQCGVSPAPSKKQPGDGQLAFGVFQHLWETGEIRHSGTETCFGGRCVHCSVAASAHYGDCLATAVARNAVRGGSTLMWTINVSHYLPEALADVRARVADLRRYLLGVNECRVLARHLRVDLGLVGWAAVGEVMHGERNGWGPHLHGLLFFDRELTQREMDLFEHRTAVGMVERVADRGWPRVLRERVFKVEPVRDAEGVGRYLSKIGWEMTGGAAKEGRSSETQTVFGLAAELAKLVGGDGIEVAAADERRGPRVRRLLALLKEWEAESKGERMMVVSDEWWDRFLPDVEERSVRAAVEAGQKLRVKDRKMLSKAAEKLREVRGVSMTGRPAGAAEDDEFDDDMEYEPAEVPETEASDVDCDEEVEEVGPIKVSEIESRTWLQIDRAMRQRKFARLVPEVMRLAKLGGPGMVAQIIEDHGALQGLRLISACVFEPAVPIWQQPDGSLLLSSWAPEGYPCVEDWGVPQASTWLGRFEAKGGDDAESARQDEARFRRALAAERKTKG